MESEYIKNQLEKIIISDENSLKINWKRFLEIPGDILLEYEIIKDLINNRDILSLDSKGNYGLVNEFQQLNPRFKDPFNNTSKVTYFKEEDSVKEYKVNIFPNSRDVKIIKYLE